MISKELLSTVLGFGIRSFEISPDKRLVQYVKDTASISNFTAINTYELAHKCKEWAWSTGLQLTTFKGFNSKWYCEIPNGSDEETHRIAPKKMSFNSNTEPEAIFKTCQWILDNKDN